MKRVLIALLIIVLLAAGGAAAYFTGLLDGFLPAETAVGDPVAAPTTADPQQENGDLPPVLAADGQTVVDARVLPVEEAQLSFSVTGRVTDVLVAENDVVTAGQPLLRLDDAQQRTAVSRAQAEVQRAQAQLDELLAGARTEEIAAATATRDAAAARLERIRDGAEPGEIAVARAAVNAAQANLQTVLQGANEQEVIAARAELANAEAEQRRAQRAFDEVKWRNDSGATPQSADLQRATNTVEAAQARLADLQSGPTAPEVAAARAEVERAQAQLALIQSTFPSDIAAAQAELEQAQAQLDLLLAGTRTETIASAEAAVAAATAALQEALVALADRELQAPFAGTVALLDISPGEQVAAGQIVIQLADLRNWEIRTEDLTEFDIVNIEPGDTATLTFDALPDLTLDGTVQRIRPIGGDLRGDIVYTVIIEPARMDEQLRWNMTAVATFESNE